MAQAFVTWIAAFLAFGFIGTVAAWAAEAARGAARVAVAANPSRKVALVIGNARYRQQPLANPVIDANSISGSLKELGFEVVTLTDVDRTQMVRALEIFKARLPGSAAGLVYFAGHGIQIDGRNYLLPVDVDMGSEDQVKYNTIRLDDVLDTLATGAPAVKIVILDACRNNPFERTRGGGGGLAAVTDAPEGTLVAFATAPGKLALDGKPGENGLYTSHLLKALQRPGLAIEEVFKATRVSVARESNGRQLPWESTSLVGRLVLRPGVSADAAATVVADAASSTGIAVRGFERRRRPERVEPGASFRDCDRCPEMVVVPAGSFRMGSPAGEAERRANEGPQREVAISRQFAVGRYEVTFEEWEACLLDGGCDRWPADQGWGRGRRPVIDVSWEDANRYAAWLTRVTGRAYRLLSETEWEYTARAGTFTARPWGDELGKNNGNCAGCGNPDASWRTSPAGSFKANPWNVADALGNVWEWVADCYNPGYSYLPIDGRAWLTGDCALRMLRGGSFLTAARGVRSAARGYYPVQRRDINIGFRVATTVE
jgi:formylglycine-generating enzyme required for sulfatase activity